jgi:hypothetical protein
MLIHDLGAIPTDVLRRTGLPEDLFAGERAALSTEEKVHAALLHSVMISQLHLEGVSAAPTKDDPPLIVDADRGESLPTALERFEPIPWRDRQISQLGCVV